MFAVCGVDRLQENRNRTKGLAAVAGDIAVGSFFLQHQHHALRQWARDDCFHPWCRDCVGQIGDNFKVTLSLQDRKFGARVIEAVAFDEVEFGLFGNNSIANMLGESSITLDSPYGCAATQDRAGECA